MNNEATQRDIESRPAGDKRPYLKPAFQHEQVFETMALACGKMAATGGPCRSANAS